MQWRGDIGQGWCIQLIETAMGQEESKQKDLITDQFNILRTISPGEYWVRRKKKGDELQLRILTFYLQEEMQEYTKLLDRRKKIKNPHLLELIEHTQINEQGMCSAAFKIRTLVEYPFKCIHDEIQERTSPPPKRYFSEDEMWSILYSCCHALYTLYLNKFNHQSLNTNHIFIDTAGIIKIADNVLVNSSKNHLSLLDQTPGQPTTASIRYISPELVNLVEDNHFYFYEKEKSDVFILAMIMLEIGNLQAVRYYNKKTKKFNFEESLKALSQAQSRYTKQLTQLLQKMLALDFKLRPRFEDIIACIQQKTVYTCSSANTSVLSNDTKTKKTPTPNHIREETGYMKTYEYPKQDAKFSLPPNNVVHVQPAQNLSQYVPKFELPQIISTESILKIQPKHTYSYPHPASNGFQFKEFKVQANGQAKRPSAFPTESYKRDQSIQNKTSNGKVETILRDIGKRNEESATPYLQLLNLTQKTKVNANQPTSTFNVTKVETVVTQPSQKPKISIKFNNSPIRIEKVEVAQIQQPSFSQPLNKQSQILKFSESKFGKIELPIGVINPNLSQNTTFAQKPQEIQIKPFEGVANEGNFVIEQYEQGKFEGFKLNDKRNGVGRFIYLNGSYYEGEWKDDAIHGFGKLYYTNGQTAYEGYWRNFTFHGTGKLYNEDPKFNNNTPIDYTDLSSIESRWVSYEGQFANDEKHGKGTILLGNGQTFSGFFVRDAAQGEGCYYKSNGEVIKGRWSKNLYIGGV